MIVNPSDNPLISVIIPAYDRPKQLEEAVRSVLAQSYQTFELIVVDDGSTLDLSPVEEMVMSRGHYFVRKEHKGVAAARNTGLSLAKGEWIALLDSDDRWLPDKLKAQVCYHLENPQYLLSQTLESWYRNGKRVNKGEAHQQPLGDAFERSLRLVCISSSSVMMHRDLLPSLRPYNEKLPVCEDYDLWIRITCRHELGLVPRVLVEKFGGHGDQLSKSEKAMDRFRVYALLKLLNDNQLSQQQRQLVWKELRYKVNILHQGAAKRGLSSLFVYQQILCICRSAMEDMLEPDDALLMEMLASVERQKLLGESGVGLE